MMTISMVSRRAWCALDGRCSIAKMDDYRPVPSSSTALISSLTSLAISNPKAIQGYVHAYSAQPRPGPAPERRRVGKCDDQELADELERTHIDAGDRLVTTWKMTEHYYRRRDCPFPVNARGLFTAQEDRKGKGRIVARGYDKFFSIGEVEWTKVSQRSATSLSVLTAVIVGSPATTHGTSLHTDLQIQWLSHPHLGHFSHRVPCELKALCTSWSTASA